MNDFKEIDAQSTEESRHSENRFLRNKYRVPDENGRPSSFLRRVYNGTLARASDWWLVRSTYFLNSQNSFKNINDLHKIILLLYLYGRS